MPGLSGRQRDAVAHALSRYESSPDASCTSPLEHLLRGLVRAEQVAKRGLLGSALFDGLQAAGADALRAAERAGLAVPAAQLLMATGRPGAALEALSRAPSSASRRHRAHLALDLGWYADALDAVREERSQGDPAAFWAEAYRAYRDAGLHQLALGEVRASEGLGVLEQAECLVALGRAPEAVELIVRPWQARVALERVVPLLRRVGAYAQARSLLAAALTADHLRAPALAELADLAFVLGDEAHAMRSAEEAGSLPRALQVRGALRMRAGDLAGARALLRAAIEEGDEVAHAWFAELQMRSGESVSSRVVGPAAPYVRAWISLRAEGQTRALACLPESLRELARETKDFEGFLLSQLASMRDRRAYAPFGEGTPLWVLRQCAARGFDEPEVARLLASGRLTEACALVPSTDPRALAFVAYEKGELERALGLLGEDHDDLRGEWLLAKALAREGVLLQDELRSAREALLRAAEFRPTLAVFLCLWRLARAEEDARAETAMALRVHTHAPALMEVADGDPERALALLEPSRSFDAYCVGPRARRATLPNAPHTPVLLGRLREVRRLLSVEPSRSPRIPHRAAEQDLADVRARFCAEGYLVLRDAFAPSRAARWRDQGAAKIRAFPDALVKGDTRGLWAFDPDDPSSWSRPRVDLHASSRMPWDAFSPALDRLFDVLLGDLRAEDRLSDYTILNLNERAGEGFSAPKPNPKEGWHIDEPGVAMELANLRNGLVVVLVLSDCAEGEGGTLLLEGSHRAVAKRLRRATNAIGPSFGEDVAREMVDAGEGRVVQVHGRAGDAYVCSSLLLHTSSPNGSGRIRWMANPMVHLRRPPRENGETPFEHSLG